MSDNVPLFEVKSGRNSFYQFFIGGTSMTCPKCHSTMLTHVVVEHNSPSAHGLSCFLCGYWLNGTTRISRPRRIGGKARK